MVYPFPQASRDIASLAIWSSHKVAASFSSQPCSSGACIGGLMTDAIWNVVNGECRLMAPGRPSRTAARMSAFGGKSGNLVFVPGFFGYGPDSELLEDCRR